MHRFVTLAAICCAVLLLTSSNAGLLPAAVLASDSAGEPGREFSKLVDDIWEFDLRADPLFATHVGDHRFDDKLPQKTIADAERSTKFKREALERLKQIDAERLSKTDRLNYKILRTLLANEIAEGYFRTFLMPITNRSGFHVSFAELPRDVPLNSVHDYDNYIARLRQFDNYVAQNAEMMRVGIREGLTLPQAVLSGYREAIEAHIVEDTTTSVFYAPFRNFPDKIPADERARLTTAGRKAISTVVIQGYKRFLAFMRDEYVPACRGSIGASALPHGREFYRHRVRSFTTLDLSPEQVHETGMAEVKRIQAEMLAVIKQVGFAGDFAAFVAELRNDPKFYADTPQQLLKETAFVMKHVDGELPKLFGKLPRTPCGIREIPAYIAPGTTTAYYQQPSGDGAHAGFYYVNTYNLKSRPLFEVEALSLHEALPGHHLQLALQQEMGDMPMFRRFSDFTAYIEGWGLYSERLGLEMGLYKDPYSNFGRLSYEMWRACRLVVDTGMHYLGWSRQQAIDFMAEHTALSEHNIRAEVDRYIAWPGQALAYKTGELKIRELRREAEERLGQRFDVRKFHDAVLASGAVPLSVLEDNIHEFIDAELKSQT